MLAASARNTAAGAQPAAGWMAPRPTSDAGSPQTSQASPVPATEPASWATAYGTTARPGNIPIAQTATVTAGFMWPPLRRPSGLMIRPVSTLPLITPMTIRAVRRSAMKIGESASRTHRTTVTAMNSTTVLSATVMTAVVATAVRACGRA